MTQRTNLLPRYESIASASARMLDAARSGQWDDLVEAERECGSLIRQLEALEAQEALRLDAAANRERIQILQRILKHDAEIRHLTQHWLRGLERLLRSTGLDRMVRSTYGTPPMAGSS